MADRAPSLLTPLRHRDFRLLWAGASGSLAGDGVFLVALAWQAYTLSPHPQGLALLGVCATGPQLLALAGGGVLSDRTDRRRLLLGADLARLLAVGSVALLVLGGAARMWQLAVLSVVYGLGAGFAAPAFDALVPQLVPEGDLEQANALEQFLRPAMLRLAGPALGGVLIAAGGAGAAFALDAITFLISAACLLAMRPGGASPAARVPASVLQESLAGLRFVTGRVWLWGTFAAATLTYLLFIGPTEVLLPYVVRESLHGSAGELGLVLASGGVGALAVAALISRTGLPRRQFSFMYASWALATLAVAGYGLATHGWQLMATCIAVNGLEAAGAIAWATTKQRLIPNELMGRVSSLDWFISIAGLPVSYALTAPAAALLGARMTLVGAGVLGAAVTTGALFLPGMRTVDGATNTDPEADRDTDPAPRPAAELAA